MNIKEFTRISLAFAEVEQLRDIFENKDRELSKSIDWKSLSDDDLKELCDLFTPSGTLFSCIREMQKRKLI